MPYTKKTTTVRTSRKNYKRRYGRKSKKGLMFKRHNRPLKIARSVLPTSVIVKLPFDGGNLSGNTTNSVVDTQFYSNNIFQPKVGVVGNQPLGYDQWTALYKNYRVHGVSIEVMCDNSSFHGGIVGIYPHTSVDKPSSLGRYLDFPETKYVMVNNGSRPLRFRKYLRNNALFNVSRQEYNDEVDYASGVGGGPTNLGYINIFRQAIDEISSTDFDIRVKLTYYVEFYGIKIIPASTQ